MPIVALFFLACYGIGLLLALLVHGAWAYHVYQLVYFMSPATRWWGDRLPEISWSYITVMVMALSVALHWDRARHASWLRLPVTKWILGLAIVFVIMRSFALAPALHHTAMIEYLKTLTIAAIAYRLIDSPDRLRLAVVFYVFGCFYVGYEATFLGRNAGARLEGIGMIDGQNANDAAAAMAPAVILLLYFAWLGSTKVRALCVVAAAFVVNGLVLFNSRGAFLGVAAGAGLFIMLMMLARQQRGGQRFFAAVIVVAGLAGAYSLTDEAFWERMGTLTHIEDGDASGSHRVEFWFATFDMLRDRPQGLGAFGYHIMSRGYLDERYFEDRETGKAVHSTWFQALAELGWPGPVLLCGMLLSTALCLRRTQRVLIERHAIDDYWLVTALGCALVSFVVAATFIDRLRAEILYWLVLFACCAYNIHCLQDDRRRSAPDPEDERGRGADTHEGSPVHLPGRAVRGRAVGARAVQQPPRAARPLRARGDPGVR